MWFGDCRSQLAPERAVKDGIKQLLNAVAAPALLRFDRSYFYDPLSELVLCRHGRETHL